MQLIIHDLTKEEWNSLHTNLTDAEVIANHGKIKNCIGCFGCWVKTPGQCIIADEYQKMGELLGKTDELVIISKCSFGGFSSFVKNVLDRSISYILPYFEIRNKEMHHRSRYKNHIKMNVILYGDEITEAEESTAKQLVEANAINLNGTVESLTFVSDVKKLKEVIPW